MTHERGRIRREGMGGFLNPPTHPEHSYSVETDLRRRPENRGSMSLETAVTSEWLDVGTRAAAKRLLTSWERPPLESAEVQEWIHQVLGYFKGCYCGPQDGEDKWNASNVRIMPGADPVLNADIHNGVHLIRKYYPEFKPTAEHFARAYWGTKPEVKP